VASLTYRGLTLLLSALAVAGQVALVEAVFGRGLGVGSPSLGSMRPALLSTVVMGAVVSLASAVLGMTMAFRRDARRGAPPMGLALAVWAYLLAYSGIVVLMSPPPESPLHAPFEGHFLLVEALGLAALLRFTAQFPSPLAAASLRDPATLPLGSRTIQGFRRWLLRPYAPWLAGILSAALCMATNAARGRPVQDAALLPLVDVFRLGALALVVLNLRRAFLASDQAGRTRITWLVLGFALLVGSVGLILGGNVLSAVTGWEIPAFNWRPVVLHLGVIGLLWGGAMGVLYQGRAQPAPAVRSVAVLVGMGTLALFLAAGLEMLLSRGGPAHFSLPRGTGTFLAMVAMALVYGRTRRPLDGFLRQARGDTAPPMAAGR
jgi:hypothetical protein